MRSIALGVAAAALAIAAPVAAAPTLNPNPSIPVYDGLPSATWSFETVAEPTGSPGSYEHVEASAAPGYGTGSLRLNVGPLAADTLSVSQSLAGLRGLSAWVRTPGSPEPDRFQFGVTVDGLHFAGTLPLAPRWQKIDLANLPLAVAGAATPTTTLLKLAASHPTTATVSFEVGNLSEAASTSASVDGWQVRANGAVQAYDFEGPHTPVTCTLAAARATITAGSRAQLTAGLLDDAGAGIGGRPIRLFAQPYDAAAAQQVSGADTGVLGGVALAQAPLVETAFVIDHAQTATLGRCRSLPLTILVKTRVNARAASLDLRTGQRLVVAGTTLPSQPGASIGLWREGAGGRARLAHARVKADGSYRLTTRVGRKGQWRVSVRVVATEGNLAGRSRTLTVRVS